MLQAGLVGWPHRHPGPHCTSGPSPRLQQKCHDVKLTGKRRDPGVFLGHPPCKLHSFASICRTVCYSACFLSNEELHENSENFMPCRQLGQTPTGSGIVYLNFPQHLEGRNASEVLSALETAGLKAT